MPERLPIETIRAARTGVVACIEDLRRLADRGPDGSELDNALTRMFASALLGDILLLGLDAYINKDN
jgi:hypothetical protein